MRFLESPDFQPSLAKKIIDQKFVMQVSVQLALIIGILLGLLDSEYDYHSGQVVETSVTNSSLCKDYPHPDDHPRQTTDTSGFKHLP